MGLQQYTTLVTSSEVVFAILRPFHSHRQVASRNRTNRSHAQPIGMAYRRLADIPWLGRALGGRGELFETPFAGGMAGREALRRWRVFIGNFVLTEACINAAKHNFCKRQTCTSSTREQGNRILKRR